MDALKSAAVLPNISNENQAHLVKEQLKNNGLEKKQSVGTEPAELKATDNNQAVLKVEDLQSITEAMNQLMSQTQKGLNFSVDTETQTAVVKVIDETTGEVIRQIPSQDALELASRMAEIAGMLLSDKV
ncbi:flagellar protein FlaG [Paraferrimonas sp. SM1919]|uniref:flagellar protein FlaG n=1 Tax=Paraferrimonas sp. SM1919 TaxID=2662263 RepID=UPI0013D173B6|nr:flagellar protein FlaG [Paraferrimonas sp. SM1919]